MKPYCLYCFNSLSDERGECSSCGGKSLPSDRRIYWNRSPKYIRIQKVIGLISTILAVIAAYTLIGAGSGPGGGWLVAIPIGFHIAVTQTARKLTMHLPYFSVKNFWLAFFVGVGLLLGYSESVFFLGLCLLSFPFLKLCKRAEKWKSSLQGVSSA